VVGVKSARAFDVAAGLAVAFAVAAVTLTVRLLRRGRS
jgi:hypothetical protein